jgi:DNA (cytosine-5)-methyltransferase 1
MKAKLRASSFFAGIGGFDIALEENGVEVVFQSEINKFCQEVLRKRFPNAHLNEDILGISASEVPDSEIFCGGLGLM